MQHFIFWTAIAYFIGVLEKLLIGRNKGVSEHWYVTEITPLEVFYNIMFNHTYTFSVYSEKALSMTAFVAFWFFYILHVLGYWRAKFTAIKHKLLIWFHMN